MGTWNVTTAGPASRVRVKVAALIVPVMEHQGRNGIHPVCVITGLAHLAEGSKKGDQVWFPFYFKGIALMAISCPFLQNGIRKAEPENRGKTKNLFFYEKTDF